MPPPAESVLTIITRPPFIGAWVAPQGEINRQPVGLRWGSNAVAVPPGVHHVTIHMPWLWQYGHAEITVDNRSDPAATVYYAAPFVTVGSGVIGFSPVRNPGRNLFLALAIGVPLLVLCTCFGTALL